MTEPIEITMTGGGKQEIVIHSPSGRKVFTLLVLAHNDGLGQVDVCIDPDESATVEVWHQEELLHCHALPDGIGATVGIRPVISHLAVYRWRER